MCEDNLVALDSGAAANLVCFKRSENRNLLLGKQGLPRISTDPAGARFKFGDGRLREVRFVADVTVGDAGCQGALAAFALGADIPALLPKGALGALEG